MTEPFRVWAPAARQVVLRDASGDRPLERDGGGSWTIAAGPRGRYRIVIDGDALPDPRSPWQPDGVAGPSALVDHDAFQWSDARWRGLDWRRSVLYELHVGTFSPEGTFDGVRSRLDHLVALGVDAIEVLPIAEFPGTRGWGYDGVLLFAPHHAYGGPDGFKRLVDACHGAGLGVILDVVYNHLGPSGNHLERFGPYFTDRYRTPWGRAVNFDDAGSDEVRRFVIDNAVQWLRDYHVDGLRLDAVHAIYDFSAAHVLEQLAAAAHHIGRETGVPRIVIAESDLNDPRLVRPASAGGLGLDAAWSDDFHHAVHVAITGERDGYYEDFRGVDDVVAALARTYVYDGRYSPHRGRTHGRSPADVPLDRFVTSVQNHDQVGNRARGDRLGHLVGAPPAAAAAALLLLGPGVPMLFQGEEWSTTAPFAYVTDHQDPELVEAVRAGRRREFAAFGWDPDDVLDPQAIESFTASVLPWDELDRSPHVEMFDWYRRLIELRHGEQALTDTDRATIRVERRGADTVVMTRGDLIVAVNVGAQAADHELGPASALVESTPDVAVELGSDATAVRLPPWGVVVLRSSSATTA